jgi:hypothetical protein
MSGQPTAPAVAEIAPIAEAVGAAQWRLPLISIVPAVTVVFDASHIERAPSSTFEVTIRLREGVPVAEQIRAAQAMMAAALARYMPEAAE